MSLDQRSRVPVTWIVTVYLQIRHLDVHMVHQKCISLGKMLYLWSKNEFFFTRFT